MTVIVAVREFVVGFAAVVTVTVPFSLPEPGETVAHVSLLLTVQSVLEVIANDFCSPAPTKLSDDGDTYNVGVTPACVTLIVSFATPVPLTVIVAVRGITEVFAAAMAQSPSEKRPEFFENVSHNSLLLTVQDNVVDVIVMLCCPPKEVKFSEVGDTDRVSVPGI